MLPCIAVEDFGDVVCGDVYSVFAGYALLVHQT